MADILLDLFLKNEVVSLVASFLGWGLRLRYLWCAWLGDEQRSEILGDSVRFGCMLLECFQCTVFTYWCLLLCLSKQPKVCPFMPSMAPLKTLARVDLGAAASLAFPALVRLLFRLRFLGVPRPLLDWSPRVAEASLPAPPLPPPPGADVIVVLLTE